MVEIVPPVFAVDGHDVSGFASVREAEQCLEPPEVEEAQIELFDSRGLRLKARLSGKKVVIEAAEQEPSGAHFLAKILSSYYGLQYGERDDPDPVLAAAVNEVLADEERRKKRWWWKLLSRLGIVLSKRLL